MFKIRQIPVFVSDLQLARQDDRQPEIRFPKLSCTANFINPDHNTSLDS